MRSNDVHTNKVDKMTATKLLQEDILNSALHCFGSHHYSHRDGKGPDATEVPADTCTFNLHDLMVSYYKNRRARSSKNHYQYYRSRKWGKWKSNLA